LSSQCKQKIFILDIATDKKTADLKAKMTDDYGIYNI